MTSFNPSKYVSHFSDNVCHMFQKICFTFELCFRKYVSHLKYVSGNVGYDAAIGEFVDLVKTGVIDPTKVLILVMCLIIVLSYNR